MRMKRFFVSEAQRAELNNLTEYRRSGMPGDLTGESFWYFLREKVLRDLGGAWDRFWFYEKEQRATPLLKGELA